MCVMVNVIGDGVVAVFVRGDYFALLLLHYLTRRAIIWCDQPDSTDESEFVSSLREERERERREEREEEKTGEKVLPPLIFEGVIL